MLLLSACGQDEPLAAAGAELRDDPSRLELSADLTLSAALVIDASSAVRTLDCRGHTLRPAQERDNSVAILVDHVDGLTIERCRIEGFDFGIVVLNAGSPSLHHNDIDVRTTALWMERVNHAAVAHNKVTYRSRLGRAIVLTGDSDDNLVRHNVVTSAGTAQGLVPRVPGGALQGTVTDVGIHMLGATSLSNHVIDGRLVQVAVLDVPAVDDQDWFCPNDNVIEDNHFDYDGVPSPTYCSLRPDVACPAAGADCGAGLGVCAVKTVGLTIGAVQINFGSKATQIRGNKTTGYGFGLSSGGVGAATVVAGAKLGRCELDTGRLCALDSECVGWQLGTCVGEESRVVNGKTKGTIIEDNRVRGAAISGIHIGQVLNVVVRGNDIRGPNTIRGISVVQDAMVSARVERNVIDGATHGLAFTSGGAATRFGATITRNDITGYVNAVLVNTTVAGASYALASEISDAALARGNHWGRDCASGAFPSALVAQENGASLSVQVRDSHPYGEPIAAIDDDALLPATCL